MGALNKKLMRDLWRLRGQVLAVAVVVASGAALLVMSLSALTSLSETTDAYYERNRFAHVFAGLERAPERLAQKISEIHGVQTVETRISAFATVEVEGVSEPISAQLVSLPRLGEPLLNQLAMRAGRLPRPDARDEAVVLEPFVEAHGLNLGDEISVLMNGAKRPVRIVGVALSPEFIYAIAQGGLVPDEARFGVIWMGREVLEAAYDLDGAFNHVSLALLRGTNPDAVVQRLDPMLERYGGVGAVARADHPSHWFLMNELEQLKTTATILPTIFLAVAAFLTNSVLARLIAIERPEISLMKAFGYSNLQVGGHYAKLALAIAALGVLLGWVVGAALGQVYTAVFAEFFRFPFLLFRPSGMEFVLSAAVCLGASLIGALSAVRGAVILPPAEAMRPPSPENFRSSEGARRLMARLDAPTRIIFRQIVRAPGRAAQTVIGVALSVAVLVMALQWSEAISALIQSHFADTQRQHATLGFHEQISMEGRYMLARLPGVLAVEPGRVVPADLSSGLRVHRGGVTGLPRDAELQVIHDARGWTMPTPAGGLVLSVKLADKLGVDVGEMVAVETLDRRRVKFEAPVAAVHRTYIDMPAYMELGALNRALDDPQVFELAQLLIDPSEEAQFFTAVKRLPGLSALSIKRHSIEKMLQTVGESVLIFVSFFTLFACALAYGVTYNAVRVALSERGRDLATLRVLGFTKWEISYILLGEAALLAFVALPLGCLAGAGLVYLMLDSFDTELFRIPFNIPADTYGKAVLIALAACVVSAALARRRLDELDLIAVLKTRE